MRSELPALPVMAAWVTAHEEIGQASPRENAPGDIPRPSERSRLDTRRVPRVRPEGGLPCLVSTRIAARVIDISTRGLCVEHTDQVEVGNLYLFDLVLPSHPTPLRLEAWAVWADSHRTREKDGKPCVFHRSGFAFVDVSAHTTAALESYVARLLRPETEPPSGAVLP